MFARTFHAACENHPIHRDPIDRGHAVPGWRSQMKAIRIPEYGDAGTLKLEEVPNLSISDDQILVRVHDVGVNPIDWKSGKVI